MKLDDIAKMAIDEVSAELEKIEAIHSVVENSDVDKIAQARPAQPQIKIEERPAKASEINSEMIFLKNLKERVEVLFEGLNETSQDDIVNKLEITLKFLEFLLASVENRLENIAKG